MPGQTVGSVHLDQYLTNISRRFTPLDAGFIANEVCPVLPVQNESDVYPVWDTGQFFATDVDDLVPDRTEPRAIEFAADREQYVCQRRELAWAKRGIR